MATSAAARTLLGLAFAAYVGASLAHASASSMFQLLFLQGGLIALLSASAYARGAYLAVEAADMSASFAAYLRFLLIGGGLAVVLATLFLPFAAGDPEKVAVVVLMTVGAVASAANGMLQGVAVVLRGGGATFLPTLIVSLAGCVAIAALWNARSIVVAAALWSLPQLITPLVLWAAQPSLRVRLRRSRHVTKVGQDHFAATGAVNAASVAAAYGLRERWSVHQPDQTVATTFFVVRLTEIGYQILYMVAASMPRVTGRLLSRLGGRRPIARLGALALVLALIGSSSTLLGPHWTIFHLVLAETLVMPSRLLAMACLLYLLRQESTRAYQLAVGLGTTLTATLMIVPPIQQSAYALQTFQALCLLPIVAVAAGVLRTRNRDATGANTSTLAR